MLFVLILFTVYEIYRSTLDTRLVAFCIVTIWIVFTNIKYWITNVYINDTYLEIHNLQKFIIQFISNINKN